MVEYRLPRPQPEDVHPVLLRALAHFPKRTFANDFESLTQDDIDAGDIQKIELMLLRLTNALVYIDIDNEDLPLISSDNQNLKHYLDYTSMQEKMDLNSSHTKAERILKKLEAGKILSSAQLQAVLDVIEEVFQHFVFNYRFTGKLRYQLPDNFFPTCLELIEAQLQISEAVQSPFQTPAEAENFTLTPEEELEILGETYHWIMYAEGSLDIDEYSTYTQNFRKVPTNVSTLVSNLSEENLLSEEQMTAYIDQLQYYFIHRREHIDEFKDNEGIHSILVKCLGYIQHLSTFSELKSKYSWIEHAENVIEKKEKVLELQSRISLVKERPVAHEDVVQIAELTKMYFTLQLWLNDNVLPDEAKNYIREQNAFISAHENILSEVEKKMLPRFDWLN